MKLYELPAAFDEVSSLITEDGELSPEAMEKLSALEMELDSKVEGCCRVIRNYESRAAAFKSEAERLAHHSKVAENNARRLKEYIKKNLDEIGITKVETELFKVRVQANPASLQIPEGLDVSCLPEEFKKVTVEPNKKAMLDAVKNGVDLPFGIQIIKGSHLRIT